MRFMPWLASVLAVAVGASLVAGGRAAGADRPIVRDVELEALQEAVRWPKADVTTVMALTSRFMATRRDADGFAYFQDRAASEPDRALFPALEGLFEARSADEVSVFRRVARVNNALAKLDRAVALDGGLPRYVRGVVLAALPARFDKARAAVDDLTWVLDNKDRFPVGLRRSVYLGLASAYTTLGRVNSVTKDYQGSAAVRFDYVYDTASENTNAPNSVFCKSMVRASSRLRNVVIGGSSSRRLPS